MREVKATGRNGMIADVGISAGGPDPRVAELLDELVQSQRRTDTWLLRLTVVIALLTAAGVAIGVIALLSS